MLDPADLARDLAHFTRVAHADAYAMIGGEPTLHPALADLLAVAKRSGVADMLEVWTNGQDLNGGESWWVYVNRLVVSRYTGKLTDEEMDAIERHCECWKVELRVIDERTVPNFSRLLEREPTSPEVTAAKYRSCFFKDYSRVLDRGYFFRCCTSPYIPRLLQGRPFGSDGLRVDETLTEADLRAFLERAEPMEACRVCAGRDGRGDPLPWREVREPNSWLRGSAGE